MNQSRALVGVDICAPKAHVLTVLLKARLLSQQFAKLQLWG